MRSLVLMAVVGRIANCPIGCVSVCAGEVYRNGFVTVKKDAT